ncbi:MAG: invasion associated locus B family protein [Azospirillaceae bacterium]|nr:invasion associated locus B family protein [Azospirillaceae bacterium]
MIRVVRGVFAAGNFLAGIIFVVLLAWQAPAHADTSERIGDWTKLCQSGSTDPRACVLTQKIQSLDTKDPVLAVGVYYPRGRDVAEMEFHLPAQVVLEKPLQMKVDNHDAMDLTINECKPGFCVAAAALDPPVITLLTGGKAAVISFVLPSGERMGVTVSLKGFGQAFRGLSKASRG